MLKIFFQIKRQVDTEFTSPEDRLKIIHMQFLSAVWTYGSLSFPSS